MLVFGMLNSQREAIHRFQNGMFDLRRAKVDVELLDGEKVEVDAGVYVWNRDPGSLVAIEERAWRVEDAMESEWFQYIVKRAEGEEKLLLKEHVL
ncbi:hypothetical protein K504DRAFT_368424 [Pleomassaria siparia CBS 279.74]|uniref:Gamma-glutamylcyclotransferase AIG2-like domain-containing protein n=1 Tax=Pleomassaria siparia CBS 279.74 TaxID=1314801 RepID=A0A6G1KP46_9PLEO|nr:hypothetical protein K504DRAFT_368424 [Pleomassaria siparia CBS 279.74]